MVTQKKKYATNEFNEEKNWINKHKHLCTFYVCQKNISENAFKFRIASVSTIFKKDTKQQTLKSAVFFSLSS